MGDQSTPVVPFKLMPPSQSYPMTIPAFRHTFPGSDTHHRQIESLLRSETENWVVRLSGKQIVESAAHRI